MTTEEDFQRALDAHPDDHTTRLVFADWLQERDDPRAEGYRALGVLRKWPEFPAVDGNSTWWCDWDGTWTEDNALPRSWHQQFHIYGKDCYEPYRYSTRREAEDAAALAFAKLPAERRAELLATNAEVPNAPHQ